jgi:hypothetical protein
MNDLVRRQVVSELIECFAQVTKDWVQLFKRKRPTIFGANGNPINA